MPSVAAAICGPRLLLRKAWPVAVMISKDHAIEQVRGHPTVPIYLGTTTCIVPGAKKDQLEPGLDLSVS